MANGDDDDRDACLWPVAGLNIVAGENDQQFLAFLQWQYSPEFRHEGYVQGFRLAAELIFAHVRATSQHQDELVFPLGMCWRHHMELQLKSLLIELQRYQREPVEAPNNHWLDRLWKEVRERLEASRPNDVGDLDNVEALLMQLHNMDRTNQEFRYAVRNDKNKTPSFGKLPWIDLAAFHESMLRLSNFFNGAGTAVYEDGRVKDENEEWLRDEHNEY